MAAAYDEMRSHWQTQVYYATVAILTTDISI